MALMKEEVDFYEAYEYLNASKHSTFITVEKKSEVINRIRSDGLNNRVVNKKLIITLKQDVFGLPDMIISGKLILSGCILAPFRLFGLAKHAYPLGDQRLDKNFECWVKRNTKDVALDELELIMQTKFPEHLSKIEKNYSSISYFFSPFANHLQINFTSDLKMEKEELNNLTEALRAINEISKGNIPVKREFTRVMNIWNALKSDLLRKIKYENNEWQYPREWYIFLSKISQSFWMDENYMKKPVQEWIASGRSPITMNMEERKAFFTYIVRQERFCEGFCKTFMERYFSY